MNQSRKRPTLKGFTLLEMIIVVVIIGVLTAIVVPISRGYYQNSRIRTENSTARVIYNSLQTICQEFEFSERSSKGSVFYGTGSKSGNLLLFVENGVLKSAAVNNGHDVSIPGGSSNAATTRTIMCSDGVSRNYRLVDALDTMSSKLGSTDPDPSNFLQRVNRIFSDYKSESYVCYIEDYSVKAVFSSDSMDSYYIGKFPDRASEISQISLEDYGYDDLKVYSNAAWGTS